MTDPTHASAATDLDRSEVVVITGAGGWLGQNLVRALADRAVVRCLVRDGVEAASVALVSKAIEPVEGDVRNPAALDALFEGTTDATVFHCAGVIHPTDGTREMFDVNVGGTELVLDRARRANAARFVHVSSNSPFGANARPSDRFDEASPPNPYMGYGRSKHEAEQLATRAHERGDLETVIVRPPWFYGPFQPERQTTWLRTVRAGRFPLIGDGSNERSMVYTGNLVHGLLRAEVAAGAPGRAFWIADAEPYPMRRVLEIVRDALRAEGLTVVDRQPRLPALVGRVAERVDGILQDRGRYSQAIHVLGELKDTIACDISAAREVLGYHPTTSLLDGMRTSIRWCLDRGQSL